MVIDGQKIDILGTNYTVKFMDFKDYPEFQLKGACGFCETITKVITICNPRSHPEFTNCSDEYNDLLVKEILRHELFHAFLAESGLGEDSTVVDCGWSQNEELVDWFAKQSPKIYKVYKKLDIL